LPVFSIFDLFYYRFDKFFIDFFINFSRFNVLRFIYRNKLTAACLITININLLSKSDFLSVSNLPYSSRSPSSKISFHDIIKLLSFLFLPKPDPITISLNILFWFSDNKSTFSKFLRSPQVKSTSPTPTLSTAAIDLTITNPVHFNTDLHPRHLPMPSAHVPIAPIAPVTQNSFGETFGYSNIHTFMSQKVDSRRSQIVCPNCERNLSCKSSLKRHLENVCGKPRNIEGMYKCEKCPRTYDSPGSLTRHNKYECGVDKRFLCELCLPKIRRFTQQSSLKRHLINKHIEKHHKVNKVSQSRLTALRNKQSVRGAITRERCDARENDATTSIVKKSTGRSEEQRETTGCVK